MNRTRRKKIFVLWVVVLLILFAACGAKENVELEKYQVSFTAENVASVTVSDPWFQKKIEDQEGIRFLISQLSEIEIYERFDPVKDEPAAGNYGHTISFLLKDGTEKTVHTCPLDEIYTIFTDETGTEYKAGNFHTEQMWEQLDYEIREKAPVE